MENLKLKRKEEANSYHHAYGDERGRKKMKDILKIDLISIMFIVIYLFLLST